MFGTLRKHSQPLWIAIIIVVVISFVVFFTPNFDPFESGFTRSADAAEVDHARSQVLLDEIIEMRQRQVMIQMLARAGRTQEALQLADGNFQQAFQLMQSPDVLGSANAGRMAGNSRHMDLNGDDYNDINSLEYRARIRLRKLALAAEFGIVVSDTAVNISRNYMVQNLSGTQEVSAGQIENLMKQLSDGGFISAGGLGQEQFDHYLRTRLILQQLNTLMTRSAGFWPDTDMADSLARKNREYATEAAFISLTNHTAHATNYTDITKAGGFTNHFNQVAFEYQVPVRHTIAYVKFDLADFEADIRREVKFDDEVQKIIDRHNTTTNLNEKLTDINGTALPNGATNLLARAEEELRQTPLGDRVFEASNAAARIKALAFRKALFSQRPFATANLGATAKQFDLELHTATFSREEPAEELPTDLVKAAFAPSLKEGKLLESAVFSTNPNHIYVLGLQKIIPLELRKYSELTEDEQKEVREGFLKSETRRRAREAGEAFRAAALASLKEGQSFTHAATNAGLSVITLPPFTLDGNADTNHTDLLKDFVSLNTLQTALETHEQNQISKADDEKENLTEFLEAVGGSVSLNESVAGYVLHITERINPANPDPNALRSFASTVRQDVRTKSQYASNDWFSKHQQQLNAEIIISSLNSRRDGLPSEIDEVNENILYKEKLLSQNLAAALERAGISEQAVIDPLKNWSDTKTSTLKKYIRENYFAETPSHPAAAEIIVPMLSGILRKHWAELDDLLADLDQLKALQAGGIDQAILEAEQSAK